MDTTYYKVPALLTFCCMKEFYNTKNKEFFDFTISGFCDGTEYFNVDNIVFDGISFVDGGLYLMTIETNIPFYDNRNRICDFIIKNNDRIISKDDHGIRIKSLTFLEN